jgi:CO/xanthine dehydrogenase Mo-binding subunit
MDGIGYVETLDAVRDALKGMNYTPEPGKKIGIGVASSYKNVGIGTGKIDGAGAAVELNKDGRVLVKIGATENGQGSDTAMAIIAAKATGISYDLIDILSNDTKHTPDGGVTTASRQTFVSGNAVLCASNIFRDRLMEFTGLLMNTDSKELIIENDKVISGSGVKIELSELYKRAAERDMKIESYYYYDPPETYPLRDSADHEPGVDVKKYDIHYSYCFGTQAAAVEVDENTGEVKVLKIVAAQDSGKSINKKVVHGQVEGAVVMGLGYALQEAFLQKEDAVITNNLNKLKIPSIKSIPQIETIIIEKPQAAGPYGAKGMGEVPINPTAPAIINAIHNATGFWITSLPAAKESVLKALNKLDPKEEKDEY